MDAGFLLPRGNMKVSEHFDLRELVHPDIFNKIGARALDFLNCNAILTLEDLRDNFGPITVNNDHLGGSYKDSGLRMPKGTVGAELSSHRFGTGFDLKFKDHKPEEVYFHILNNQGIYPYISRMENAERTVTWLHVEFCTNKHEGEIIIFNP